MRYEVVTKVLKHYVYDNELYKVVQVFDNDLLSNANAKAAAMISKPEPINPLRKWVVCTTGRFFKGNELLDLGFEPFGIDNGKVIYKRQII